MTARSASAGISAGMYRLPFQSVILMTSWPLAWKVKRVISIRGLQWWLVVPTVGMAVLPPFDEYVCL